MEQQEQEQQAPNINNETSSNIDNIAITSTNTIVYTWFEFDEEFDNLRALTTYTITHNRVRLAGGNCSLESSCNDKQLYVKDIEGIYINYLDQAVYQTLT